MSGYLQRDLEHVQQQVLALSGLVEEMIDDATRALLGPSLEAARRVTNRDGEVDRQEVEIENACLRMLVLHHPVARDLRRILAILKVNNELERCADLAVNVAERSEEMVEHEDFRIPEKLRRMVKMAIDMLRGAVDALVSQDPEAARRIRLLDDDVDQLNREIIEELRAVMRSDTHLVDAALHCFSVTRHIERIADHATNIAEDVVFLVEGAIVRHAPPLAGARERSP